MDSIIKNSLKYGLTFIFSMVVLIASAQIVTDKTNKIVINYKGADLNTSLPNI